MFMINWIEKLLRKLPPTTPEASASYLAGLSGFSFFDTSHGPLHGGSSGSLMARTDQLAGQRVSPGLGSVVVVVVVAGHERAFGTVDLRGPAVLPGERVPGDLVVVEVCQGWRLGLDR